MQKQANDKHTLKHDIIFTTLSLAIATILSFSFFQITQTSSANIALFYTLALILIARYTSGYAYGIISSLFCVIFINWCFTYPYFSVNFTLSGYPITFLGMLAITLIISAMTTRLKRQDEMIVERERKINEAEKERIRANLLRAVSHDLRTPLTSIIGASASYMENTVELTEEDKWNLMATINEDAHWLLNMVENLLSVTRIQGESGKVSKELEVVEEVVSEAIIRLEKRIPNVSVEVSAPEHMLMLPMDPLLIEQVLINLMENAVVHSESTAPVRLLITEESDTVTFHVIDYGKGINESSITELFSGQIQSLQNPDTQKGFGIGLSICRTIIQAHGGTITAHNHTNGTEFAFSLPKEDS